MIHRYAPAATVAVLAGLCLSAWQGWLAALITVMTGP